MKFEPDYQYTKDHEWISIENNQATIGISAYALDQLGDVVHVELPEPGQKVVAGESFGTIESTKTVSDLYSPVDGEVIESNSAVLSNPEVLADDCYHEGWLLKIKPTSKATKLMSAKEYESFLEESDSDF